MTVSYVKISNDKTSTVVYMYSALERNLSVWKSVGCFAKSLITIVAIVWTLRLKWLLPGDGHMKGFMKTCCIYFHKMFLSIFALLLPTSFKTIIYVDIDLSHLIKQLSINFAIAA